MTLLPIAQPHEGVGGGETGEHFTQMIFRFSLLYKHVKMLVQLVSIIFDCIWPRKVDVVVEKAP